MMLSRAMTDTQMFSFLAFVSRHVQIPISKAVARA